MAVFQDLSKVKNVIATSRTRSESCLIWPCPTAPYISEPFYTIIEKMFPDFGIREIPL